MAGKARWIAVLGAVGLMAGGAVALAAEEHGVEVSDDVFAPDRIEIAAGDTVVWEQTGSNPHSVTADDGSFDSSPDCPVNLTACMGQGDRFERTFEAPGEYAYHCKIHGGSGGQGMSGVVVVAAAEEPAAEEPPTTEPAPAPVEEAAPVEAAPVEEAAPTGADRELPATGASPGVLAATGVLVALAGVGVTWLARRPRLG